MAISDILFGTAPSAEFRSMDLATPEQKERLKALLRILGGDVESADPLREAGTENLSAGTAAIRNILQRDATDIDTFFETNIKQPLLEDFERDILPQIARSGAVRGGSGLSGEVLEQENRAREDLLESLVRSRADVALRGRETDTNAILQASGLGGQLSTAQLGERHRSIEELLNAIGLRTKENIAVSKGGSEGLVQSFLSGVGGGAGKKLGAKFF